MGEIANFPITSFYFSLPYLAIALFVLMIGYHQIWNGRSLELSRKSLFGIGVLFLLFFGLRWHIMTDSIAYENEYYTIKPNFSWKYVNEHSGWWDSGYVIFTMICQCIKRDFHFFIFINTLVDILLFSVCLKKFSKNYALSILFFLAFQGIITEINLLRNIKAILLFVFSIKYIRDRNLLKFLICNVVGYYFHSSALLYFPMYWVLNKEYKFNLLIIISLFSTLIYLLNVNIVQGFLSSYIPINDRVALKMAYYLEQSDEQKLSIGTIERILTMVLALYMYYNTKNKDRLFLLFFNSYIVFYVLYSFFGFNYVFRDRVPNLFIYSYWFLYPYLYDYYKNIHSSFKYLFVFLIFAKIGMSTRMCAAYYENIMFETSTKKERLVLIEKSKNL